jgi:hypothetical protein
MYEVGVWKGTSGQEMALLPSLKSFVPMGNFYMTDAAVLCSGNKFAKIKMILACLHIGCRDTIYMSSHVDFGRSH